MATTNSYTNKNVNIRYCFVKEDFENKINVKLKDISCKFKFQQGHYIKNGSRAWIHAVQFKLKLRSYISEVK